MSGMELFTTTLAPALGAVIANLLYLAPLKEVLGRRKLGNMGPLNPVVFPMILSNCLGFTTYGFLAQDLYIVFANFLGMYLAIFYFMTSLRLSESKSQVRLLEIMMLVILGIWGVIDLIVLCVPEVGLKLVGIVGVVFSLLMFASPLTMIARVVSTKNSASINFLFMVATNVNCLLWCIYGYVIMDLFVLIPNVGGLFLGLVQMMLVLWYPRVVEDVGNNSAMISRKASSFEQPQATVEHVVLGTSMVKAVTEV